MLSALYWLALADDDDEDEPPDYDFRLVEVEWQGDIELIEGDS